MEKFGPNVTPNQQILLRAYYVWKSFSKYSKEKAT